MSDLLSSAHPKLATSLGRLNLADLPTPVSTATLEAPSGRQTIWVKRDDISSREYGGNKVRKLEYIFERARQRGARRVATFGAVGSNHALATAIFARQSGLGCTCFLTRQPPTPSIARTLNMHLQLGTEIVRLSRSIDRLATLRRYLHGRHSWVVPLGGSSWLGAVGFVNAALEIADQVRSGMLPAPERIYIANGTMGSSAGLALGLALAGLATELHAVRVVDDRFASPGRFLRLMRKTNDMLRRLDPSVPADLADRARLCWRNEFFAGGYAEYDDVTLAAVATAKDELELSLETTYTGKAMAALLHDVSLPHYEGEPYLFWNTYNSRPLPATGARPSAEADIPPEFLRYFD